MEKWCEVLILYAAFLYQEKGHIPYKKSVFERLYTFSENCRFQLCMAWNNAILRLSFRIYFCVSPRYCSIRNEYGCLCNNKWGSLELVYVNSKANARNTLHLFVDIYLYVTDLELATIHDATASYNSLLNYWLTNSDHLR